MLKLVLLMLHLLAIGAIIAVGLRSDHFRWSRAFIAVVMLGWADLIFTAHLLSLTSALNFTFAYVLLSISLAFVISFAVRLIPFKKSVAVFELTSTLDPRLTRYLAWILILGATAVVAALLLLAYGLIPANPDSVSYRFPRVYWYFGQGSLMHFTNHSEPRPLFYPLNAVLAYMPLVHHQQGPRLFSLLSLFSWGMIGLITYVFSRDLGGTRVFSAATAMLICTTPNILIQSLSTNDEIIAAMPMLAGLFFLHRWFLARQDIDLVIAATGMSISAGTKLHLIFFWPLLVFIGLMLVVRHKNTFAEVRRWNSRRGFILLATLGLFGSILAFSFLGYNYLSTGKLTAWEFHQENQNKPFSIYVALQTITVYFSQIVLTPIADLHIAFTPQQRAQHYIAFNSLFAPLFAWVDNGPAYTSAFYRFSGINGPSAAVFNEQTVFIGFTWLMALMSAAWLFSRWTDGKMMWGRYHIAALLVWIVTYSATSKYIEGVTVYLGYATIIAAPAMVYAFAPIRRRSLNAARWMVVSLVLASHAYFVLEVLLTSPRNLISLALIRNWPVSRGTDVDQEVINEIGRAKQGLVQRSIAWEQPYWALMAWNPDIRQFRAWNPEPLIPPPGAPTDDVSLALRYNHYVAMPLPADRRLNVYTFPQIPLYGTAIPLRVPDMSGSGLVYIGDLRFALGEEWVFGVGNGVESRYPGRDRFIVQKFEEQSKFGHEPEPGIAVSSVVYGLDPLDRLQFRYELEIDGKISGSTEWSFVPGTFFKAVGMNVGNTLLRMQVRNGSDSGTIHSVAYPVRSTKPLKIQ